MIIKGAACGAAGPLARNLLDKTAHDAVEVLEIAGVAGINVDQALREMAALVGCTQAKHGLYHAHIDPRAEEPLTPDQWARAVQVLTDALGFAGQPRVVVRHIKAGRAYVHVVWSRIDIENRRAISDSHNYHRHAAVARQLEQEFGLTPAGAGP